ncbi:DUF6221 family protein [Paenarthrobacter sp. NPDC018779]|uniref:DUF6221 family protein n=1 Tax=Paenarthrobacter sp. NPDC018779 TaxID=3364375 RepID=UPI0037C95487
MTSIIEFLEARIAEDEAAARACDVPAWSIRDEPDEHLWVEGLSIHAADSNWDACIAVADARHAVRHNPARVLAECAAKRAIMREHELDLGMREPYCDSCAEWWMSELGEGPPMVKYPCPTVKAVAAVYKDHPDYQQEWAIG